MNRRVRIASALAACAILSSCATPRPATKAEEPPGLSVRLPIADAATLNIESEPSPGHPDMPPPVADETPDPLPPFFKVNYSPVKKPSPPVGEEKP